VKKSIWILAMVFFGAILPARGQSGSATAANSNGSSGCQVENARQFDFLVGDWVGRNELEVPQHRTPKTSEMTIEKILGGCAIHEKWLYDGGVQMTRAELWRMYDSRVKKWMLYYVSDELQSQVWEGRLDGQTWGFYHTWTINGKDVLSRQIWTPSATGFTRRIEHSSDDGKTWSPWFTGEYVARGTEGDDAAIRRTATFYIEGGREKDRAKLTAAFSDVTNLAFVDDKGELKIVPVAKYIEGSVTNTSVMPKRTVTIERVQRVGTAAVVEVVSKWGENTVTDFLSMLKIQGEWKIVAKTFDRNLKQ
jgi:hypothetical protein